MSKNVLNTRDSPRLLPLHEVGVFGPSSLNLPRLRLSCKDQPQVQLVASHILDGTGSQSLHLHKSRNKSLLSSPIFPFFPFFRQSFLWSPNPNLLRSFKKPVFSHDRSVLLFFKKNMFITISDLCQCWRKNEDFCINQSNLADMDVLYGEANKSTVNKTGKNCTTSRPSPFQAACFYPTSLSPDLV